MIVSSDYLAALLTNYQLRFNQSVHERVESNHLRPAVTEYQSDTLHESVPWSGDVPSVQDVTDGMVQFEDIRQYLQTLTNREYQAGVEVERTAFDDDRFGVYDGKIDGMARAAADDPYVQVGNLLEGSTLAYDDAAFFGTSRTIGDSAAIANTQTGSGTSSANIATDLATADAVMFKFQTDKGNQIGWLPNAIFIPIDLNQAFWDYLNANSNVNPGAERHPPPGSLTWTAGRYTVYIVPQLTDTDDWFVGRVDADVKPFVLQMREAPRLEGTTSTDSYEWRVLRKAQYTTYGRYVVGWGDPRSLIRFTN